MVEKDISPAKESKEEMTKILKNLRKKMSEIDEMAKELEEKRKEFGEIDPKQTKKLLEEIKVPALSLLK
jgi:hypothetical protein